MSRETTSLANRLPYRSSKVAYVAFAVYEPTNTSADAVTTPDRDHWRVEVFNCRRHTALTQYVPTMAEALAVYTSLLAAAMLAEVTS